MRRIILAIAACTLPLAACSYHRSRRDNAAAPTETAATPRIALGRTTPGLPPRTSRAR